MFTREAIYPLFAFTRPELGGLGLPVSGPLQILDGSPEVCVVANDWVDLGILGRFLHPSNRFRFPRSTPHDPRRH